MTRSFRQTVVAGFALFALLLSTAGAESTEELLRELEQLKKEVERRRASLNRELSVLKQALGSQESASQVPSVEAGMMRRTELEAELRMMREELQILREEMAKKRPAGTAGRVKIQGQMRTRFEWTDNDFQIGRADLAHLLRTRVSVIGAPYEHTKVVVQAQDSRLFGEETSTLGDGSGDQIDFHQAYLQLDQVFDQPIALKFGRQEIVYGGQRLVGAVGWHNVGRSFDAASIRIGSDAYVDLFNAKLRERGTLDRNLYGVYGHVESPARVVWEPYLLFEHDKNSLSDNIKRATVGLYATGFFTGTSGHGFSYELEGALQTGEVAGQDVLAYLGTGSASYVSPSWRKHKVTVGFDFLSGDDDLSDNDNKAFDTLFATNHKYYGLMDLFINIPNHTGQMGLMDAMLKGQMKASANVKLSLDIHHFQLVEGIETALGQEIDTTVDYTYNQAYRLQWGAGVFVPGDAMKTRSGGDEIAFMTYLQTIVAF